METKCKVTIGNEIYLIYGNTFQDISKNCKLRLNIDVTEFAVKEKDCVMTVFRDYETKNWEEIFVRTFISNNKTYKMTGNKQFRCCGKVCSAMFKIWSGSSSHSSKYRKQNKNTDSFNSNESPIIKNIKAKQNSFFSNLSHNPLIEYSFKIPHSKDLSEYH